MDRRSEFVQFAHNAVDAAPCRRYGWSTLVQPMSAPGPAQLDLIRRYARTLREMHADAMRARPDAADRAGRITRAKPAGPSPRPAAKAVPPRPAS